MGCDIHLFVEILKDGKWICIGERNKYGSLKLDIGRSYNLFHLLGGVRSYSIRDRYEGDLPEPLSDCYGLPEDVSEEVKKESESWEFDGHSHSWLLLKEILEFDLDSADLPKYKGYESKTMESKLYPYKNSVLWFFEEIVPKLKEFGEPSKVRLVFWFDN